ncbi:MAG: hypothetical protein NTV58_06720 [Deltaproteobacteria bacterium]|nr:hypothetical protein [Deltaproteobacteria bacterium]
MTDPSLLIRFDPATWRPSSVCPVGQTDVETTRLRELADRMLDALAEDPAK